MLISLFHSCQTHEQYTYSNKIDRSIEHQQREQFHYEAPCLLTIKVLAGTVWTSCISVLRLVQFHAQCTFITVVFINPIHEDIYMLVLAINVSGSLPISPSTVLFNIVLFLTREISRHWCKTKIASNSLSSVIVSTCYIYICNIFHIFRQLLKIYIFFDT